MKINPDISLDDFCAEMQHRVIRYSLRSLTVRQALRFARKHDNPEFYRVATNKIHAQRQFQREMNGPGIFERVFDYFSLGSLREVVVTLLLVGLAVVGIDAGRKLLNGTQQPTAIEQMDVDQLAKRLGILLEDTRGPIVSSPRIQIQPSTQTRDSSTAVAAEVKPRISDEDVQRIVAAVLVAMQEKEKPATISHEPGVSLVPTEAETKTIEQADTSKVSLVSSEIGESPTPE
jgi:hypothetical protein